MPARPTSPPPFETFATRRPAAGPLAVGVDLGGLVIVLEGLDEALAEALSERHRAYLFNPSEEASRGSGGLRVRVGVEQRDYFIDPPPSAEANPVHVVCDGSRVRYLGYRVAGWFDTAGGRGDLLLARGGYEPAERAIENYVRAAVAWQAAGRGGALVHAAGAVRRGRGYLFFGSSGAGKSTLCEHDRRGRIVSDDLSLVLPGKDNGIELVGSPFRGTYTEGPPVVGRFPLAAGFRLFKAATARVREAPRARLLTELVGSLPFVAEAFAARPDLFARIEQAFRDVPLAHLDFRKDDSYWDAIDAAGL